MIRNMVIAVVVTALAISNARAQIKLQDDIPSKILELNLDSQLKLQGDYLKLVTDRYAILKAQRDGLDKELQDALKKVDAANLGESATAAAKKAVQQDFQARRQQIQDDIAYLSRVLGVGPVYPPPAYPLPAVVPCPPVMQQAPLFRAMPHGRRATGLKLRNIDQFKSAMAKLQSTHPRFVSVSPRVRADTPLEAAFDIRKTFQPGIAYAVQDQGQCGSCWGFAAVAAFEASFDAQFKREATASEQFVLSCANKLAPTQGTEANCSGAYVDAGLATLAGVGSVDRSSPGFQYTASERPDLCNTAAATYKAKNFGPVNVNSNAPPSDDMLKRHIKEHGAVVVGLFVGNEFRNAQNGVAEDFVVRENVGDQGDNGHAVAIIGWDDAKGAWLVRNSWGSGFGNTGGFGSSKGYIWMQYGKSNIGAEAFWVDADSTGSVGPTPVAPTDIQNRIDYWTKLGRS